MPLPIYVGAPYSDISSGSRRSSRAWPATDRGHPSMPSASDASVSNQAHRCCVNSCHRAYDADCARNKKKRQGNNQGQRPCAPSPISSASSSTKVATAVPHLHYLYSIPSYGVMPAYPPDPMHNYIHPAHAQAAPSPQAPLEIPREIPQARCTCPQPAASPEPETRNCCCCGHSDDSRSENSGDFDDVASESSTDAVAGHEYETPAEYHYYHPFCLAVPFGTPIME
ncbi:hypothetical protein PENDEC_c018G04470 [Penicillium decumbens]|uniref:Uncharacterized protein n=1 Tax=Penicillium decumbens TaxID=69771 RepID=A0A1V6P7E6_PENDC|nr:hypothetical protein PENDEC_c018G04470 [Penicillium decumbens]